MANRSSSLVSRFLALGISTLGMGQGLALTQAELAGNWRISQLITPDTFQETYYNPITTQTEIRDINGNAPEGSFLVDVNEHGNWETRSGNISVDASGNFTGSYTGTAILNKSGKVLVTTDGETIPFLVNSAGSLMVRSARTGDGQEVVILTKNPTDATTAGLQGTWQYISFRTPGRITKNIIDGRISDLYFEGDFEALTDPVSIDGAGNISGTVGGQAISGSISTTSDGDVSMTIGDTEHFYLNSTKDLMCKVDTEVNNDAVGMAFLVKLSGSSGPSLAGPWRYADFRLPNRLVESYFVSAGGTNRFSFDDQDFAKPGEQLVDTYFISKFEVGSGNVGLSDDGTISGAATGTFTFPANGSTTISTDGDDPESFFVMQSGDVLIRVQNRKAVDGDQGLAFVVKVPLESKQLVIEPGENGLELLWLGQSDVKLQRTSNLFQWDDVPGTTGQSGFGINTNVVFFRLLQNTVE